MTPALEHNLRALYPDMLANLRWNGPCQAFEHDDGWYRVVARMLELLEPHGVRLLQVKAKFGLLRVYVDRRPYHPDDEVYQIIADAERRSKHVCQRCGFGDWSGLVGACQGCGP